MSFKLIGSVVAVIVIAVIGAMYASSLTENPNYNQYILLGLNVLVLLGVAIVPFAIKNHTASYLKEHGAGLAKIEQIEDLTRLVEEVKQEFHDESLALKAKLDVKSGVATSLKNEERLAVINLNANLYKWFNCLVGETNSRSIKENEELELKIDGLYINLGFSESTFKLFIEDQYVMAKYLNLKRDMVTTFALRRTTTNTKIKIQINRLIEPTITRPITEKDLISNRIAMKEIRDSIEDYGEFVMESYGEFTTQIDEFQTSCRELLYKI